mmetsp:Transcript_8961/g.37950  ORF Transcript_8961/g.37950 Transcript_8961/m.37950 type:complete len:246 (+) Transcript_8961:552-1289(+)
MPVIRSRFRRMYASTNAPTHSHSVMATQKKPPPELSTSVYCKESRNHASHTTDHSPVHRSMMPKLSDPAKMSCMTSRALAVSLSFICSEEALNRCLVSRFTCSRSARVMFAICSDRNAISCRVADTRFSQSRTRPRKLASIFGICRMWNRRLPALVRGMRSGGMASFSTLASRLRMISSSMMQSSLIFASELRMEFTWLGSSWYFAIRRLCSSVCSATKNSRLKKLATKSSLALSARNAKSSVSC